MKKILRFFASLIFLFYGSYASAASDVTCNDRPATLHITDRSQLKSLNKLGIIKLHDREKTIFSYSSSDSIKFSSGNDVVVVDMPWDGDSREAIVFDFTSGGDDSICIKSVPKTDSTIVLGADYLKSESDTRFLLAAEMSPSADIDISKAYSTHIETADEISRVVPGSKIRVRFVQYSTKIFTGNMNDHVDITGSFNITVDTAGGDDYVRIFSAALFPSIRTDLGNDTVDYTYVLVTDVDYDAKPYIITGSGNDKVNVDVEQFFEHNLFFPSIDASKRIALLNIVTYDGDDTINVVNNTNMQLIPIIMSGDHNDKITTNIKSPSLIAGGNGSDVITTGPGNDLVVGSYIDISQYEKLYEMLIAGNISQLENYFEVKPSSDRDIIDTGAGDDIIIGADGDDVLHGGDGADRIYGNRGENELYGDSGIDVIYGGKDRDRIWGGDDSDAIYGGDGDDDIYGELGDDSLNGENGSDLIKGGSDNDYVFGGSGNNLLYGNGGNDRIYGGPDRDRQWGGEGNDYMTGNGGSDDIYGENGDDTLYGGDGNDLMKGGRGNDSVSGEDGDDELYGNEDNDILRGGNGKDKLYGGTGNDFLRGDNQNDLLDGEEDTDDCYGGDGSDTLTHCEK